MTKAEVTQIFAVLSMAYPSAELFKAPSKEALEKKLAPTIALWATCLRDVDFWTGQKATVKVCQTCKYPPSIAEMREAADAVRLETAVEIEAAYRTARNICLLYGRERGYSLMPDRARKVIDAMGGMDAFAPPEGDCFAMLEFQRTYDTMLRSNPTGLPGEAGRVKALG